MTEVDLAHLEQWIGKEQEDQDLLSARHARLMAATVGIPNEGIWGTAAAALALDFLLGRPAPAVARSRWPCGPRWFPAPGASAQSDVGRRSSGIP